MEVGEFSLNSDVVALERLMLCSILEALVAETLFAAQKSLAWLLVTTGSLLKDINVFPTLMGTDGRFPIDELHRRKHTGPENKDASDTDDGDEDEDDGDDEDRDDDAGDEDFSGEEGGDDEDDGDPEEDPEANGNGGSDDEDGDDDDGDEEDEDEEDEEEEDEDDEDQPPAKKRK
ncbi:uncharacterized protein LOC127807014 [Diospyros lotus]|uniref:uncharacterized protein LOC127807014 n=1 Tax=Diospyros lotus TaxID=55363 RepID=UPI0022516EC8|nr:uncharacterized protein LOC127807014 [Diospyros lotus]XP_052200636.1 uncharacterized protein LOC127807014 [Diospyros lotus]